MEEQIGFRKAEVADCESLGKMISLASGGVVDFLFHSLVPEMTPAQIIANNMARQSPAHSHQNTLIASCEGVIAGMALAFPAEHHYIGDEAKEFFPADRLAHLHDFYAARVKESYLLDALYVVEKFRRKGVGTGLIEQVKSKALASGFTTLSLIVFADNPAALALYNRQGFKVVRPVTLEPDALIPHHGGCLLMKCEL